MLLTIDEKEISLEPGSTFGQALQLSLSGKKFSSVVAAQTLSGVFDLSASIPEGTSKISPVFLDSSLGLDILRHSTAHIMATAVKRLFPDVKVAIGPSIATGFYYDFDTERAFTTEDFSSIEAEMHRIIDEKIPFVRCVVEKKDALDFFSSSKEIYKIELLEALTDETITTYELADFVDLCRGPHLPHTGFARNFTLLSVAGAYWRGDEKNKMLSRIYGTVYPSEKELKQYLHFLEEAKRRDHRKLGKELGLFSFHEDITPGMVFWHPKGMMLRTILEDFLRREHLKRGYSFVQGPQLLRTDVWHRSGHYENYGENMYFSEIDNDSYAVKPMNCVGHILIYADSLKSYRDLPVRYAEFGVVHRHELSGALHGLLRVRQFTQDDAHLFCQVEQLEDEILEVMKFIRDLFVLFGFSYKIAVSTKPEKYIGSDLAWENATSALVKALEKAGIEFSINEGDGAFYGPKIDCKVTDSLGREWQCSTIQCDFTLPERFELEYVGQDGERHRPVMVHRAILGSMERFIGILIEHCAGVFPLWLAPVQARVLTITSTHDEYAEDVCSQLIKAGIRVEKDLRNEKLGYKVRQAQLEKIPFVLVIGDKEKEDGGVNIRRHGGENLGFKTIDEFVEFVRHECEEPFKQGGMSYRFS